MTKFWQTFTVCCSVAGLSSEVTSAYITTTTTTKSSSNVIHPSSSLSFPYPVRSVVSLSSRMTKRRVNFKQTTSSLHASNEEDGDDSRPADGSSMTDVKISEPELKFARSQPSESTINLDELVSKKSKAHGDDGDSNSPTEAATNTINERLMAELKAAENRERFGESASGGKKGRKLSIVDGFGRPRKTDEEIRAAIEKARDLNGVNPIVAILGSLFALGGAALLWYGTNQLGIFFAEHPVESEVYFVVRTSQVVRNMAMGLISLASGFFGVTGIGILGLGIRVAYGVMTGELDPTPIQQPHSKQDKTDTPNVWDLMMNKKPGRRGGGKKSDNNPFGV